MTSVDIRKHSIKDIGGRSCKKHEDPSKGMYDEVDDSGRDERGKQRPLRLALHSH